MSVYILHLDTKYKHALHYVGFADMVEERLWHHRNGTGAKFTKFLSENGITFKLARVFEGEDRNFERKLKNTNNTKRYCPICSGDKTKNYKPKEKKS